MGQNLKNLSAQNYTVDLASMENLEVSALIRIADATEKMAGNYTKMEGDLKWYKEDYERKTNTINSLYKTISAQKGVITKLKKKIGNSAR